MGRCGSLAILRLRGMIQKICSPAAAFARTEACRHRAFRDAQGLTVVPKCAVL
jgi:hypothetical protein